MGRAVRYQEQFCELIRTAYGIAERCGRFDEAPARAAARDRALTLYEELYLMHISCLYELRRGREAIEGVQQRRQHPVQRPGRKPFADDAEPLPQNYEQYAAGDRLHPGSARHHQRTRVLYGRVLL